MSSTETRKAMEETSDLLRTIAWGLDLASEVPCSKDECERPAVLALYPPCAHMCAACEPCRIERDAWFRAHPGYTAYCTTCQSDVPLPLQWRPL